MFGNFWNENRHLYLCLSFFLFFSRMRRGFTRIFSRRLLTEQGLSSRCILQWGQGPDISLSSLARLSLLAWASMVNQPKPRNKLRRTRQCLLGQLSKKVRPLSSFFMFCWVIRLVFFVLMRFLLNWYCFKCPIWTLCSLKRLKLAKSRNKQLWRKSFQLSSPRRRADQWCRGISSWEGQ